METTSLDRQISTLPDNFAPLTPIGPTTSFGPTRVAPRRRIAGFVQFALLVVLPVALAGVYFLALAADRYESVSLFVVRNPTAAISPLVAQGKAVGESVAQAGVPRIGQDDSFVVRDFILSRSAMRILDQQIDLRAVASAPKWDLLWHFPRFYEDNTDEALYRQYLRLVTVRYDFNTGGSELRIQGLSPEIAHRTATILLTAAEDMVNRLNQRSEADGLRGAEQEVADARKSTSGAIDRLTAFREREQIIDPSGHAKIVGEVLGRLMFQLVESRAELDVLRRSAARSPQLPFLEARVASIQTQLERERLTLAGSETALASRIAEYERLALDKEFSARRLMAALTVHDTARREAIRKKTYLERVADPSIPDEPAAPWRVTSLLTTLLCALSLFAVVRATRDRRGAHA